MIENLEVGTYAVEENVVSVVKTCVHGKKYYSYIDWDCNVSDDIKSKMISVNDTEIQKLDCCN